MRSVMQLFVQYHNQKVTKQERELNLVCKLIKIHFNESVEYK